MSDDFSDIFGYDVPPTNKQQSKKPKTNKVGIAGYQAPKPKPKPKPKTNKVGIAGYQAPKQKPKRGFLKFFSPNRSKPIQPELPISSAVDPSRSSSSVVPLPPANVKPLVKPQGWQEEHPGLSWEEQTKPYQLQNIVSYRMREEDIKMLPPPRGWAELHPNIPWNTLTPHQKKLVFASHRRSTGSGFNQRINIEPLSTLQQSRLRNGHAVRVKFSKTGISINVNPEQLKKIIRSSKAGRAATITLDAIQQAELKLERKSLLKMQQQQQMKPVMGRGVRVRLDTEDRALPGSSMPLTRDLVEEQDGYQDGEIDGEGFKDFVKQVKRAKIGKKIVKYAKEKKILKRVGDAVVERAIRTIAGSGSDMDGEGFKDFVKQVKRAKIGKKIVKYAKEKKILKRVGDAAVERAIKTIAGSGTRGGALYPAGVTKRGGALYPAGVTKRGGALFPA
jgi:hypothetical protein